jgi:hypothetical protein
MSVFSDVLSQGGGCSASAAVERVPRKGKVSRAPRYLYRCAQSFLSFLTRSTNNMMSLLIALPCWRKESCWSLASNPAMGR